MKKLCGIITVVTLLTGCGWHPLYQTQDMATDNLNMVWIDTISGPNGIQFRNNLMDLFYLEGAPKHPLYVLRPSLNIRTRSLGIKQDDTATRGQIYFESKYTLYDRETLKPLHTGSAHTITSYNILDNQYSTTVSRDEAYKNGLRSLSDKIRMRLAIYFKDVNRN